MELFKHQKEAAEFVASKGGGAVYHDIGLGKTLTALTAFGKLREKTPGLKMLVICPLSLVEGAWGEDIVKWTKYNYHNLRDKKDKEADIYIINYEALLSKPLYAKLAAMAAANPMLCVLDESSRLRNPKAKTTKLLLSLSRLFKHRIVMSGTPAPNSEAEYWGQITFLTDGVFNKSFYAFRNYYFHLARDGQAYHLRGQVLTREAMATMFQKGWKYAITPNKRTRLLEAIKPYCHYAKKDDCLDLPDQIDELRYIELDPVQKRKYEEMRKHLLTEIQGQLIAAQAALTKAMKLREITSGFCMNDKGESLPIGKSGKLKALAELSDEFSGQAIIWAEFKWEIERIKELLPDSVTLYSGTKDRDESIRKFKNRNCRWLIAHPRSAGHGLTFINCSVQIFFSLSYSYELYEQARGRTHRAGQINKCVYIHLLGKDTIDEQIYKVVRNKQDMMDIVKAVMG